MKKQLSLLGLLAFTAIAARAAELPLPAQTWTSARHASFWKVLSVTRQPEDLRKLAAFLEAHRDGWEAGLPDDSAMSYISLEAEHASATFGLASTPSGKVLACEGQSLALSDAEAAELSGLLVDRRPPKDPWEEFMDFHCPSPYRKAPSLLLMRWTDQ